MNKIIYFTRIVTAFLAILVLNACKTGRAGTTGSTPLDTAVSRTLLQADCKGTDSEFSMRFSITGLQRNPEVEADILMDVINNVTNSKVVTASPGKGFYGDKEYIYVRFAAGGLTLDWQNDQYFGAATVNADPETSAIEVKCVATPMSEIP